MLDNRYIQIVQQPPAIVVCGAPFTFVAYCPKSNYNNNSHPYGYQDVLQPAHALDDRLTHRNGFATAHVIPADSRRPSLLLERESGEIVVGGNTRAEFNPMNENDRTMKFEFAISRVGIFTAVVRLHKRNSRRSSHGRVRRGDYIITSVTTRRIQVVDKLDRQGDDAGLGRARHGRLTPPPAFDLSRGDLNGRKVHWEDKKEKSKGPNNLRKHEMSLILPDTETKNGGESWNGRKGMKSQPGSRLISTVSAVSQEKDGNDSEPKNGDKWSDDDDKSDDDGGVKLS